MSNVKVTLHLEKTLSWNFFNVSWSTVLSSLCDTTSISEFIVTMWLSSVIILELSLTLILNSDMVKVTVVNIDRYAIINRVTVDVHLNTAQQILNLRKPPGNGFFVSFQIGLNSVKDKYHWYTVAWSLLRVDSCLFVPRTIVNLSYSCITQQSQQSASLSSCSKAAGESGLRGSWFRFP